MYEGRDPRIAGEHFAAGMNAVRQRLLEGAWAAALANLEKLAGLVDSWERQDWWNHAMAACWFVCPAFPHGDMERLFDEMCERLRGKQT